VTGFVNAILATATAGTLATTSPATPTSNVGSYAIKLGSDGDQRQLHLRAGSTNATALTINRATLTPGLTETVSKEFDGNTAATLAANNRRPPGVGATTWF
jgi:hypothetical protein